MALRTASGGIPAIFWLDAIFRVGMTAGSPERKHGTCSLLPFCDSGVGGEHLDVGMFCAPDGGCRIDAATRAPTAATSFSGYVGQEFSPKGEPFAALEQAYDICNV